MVCLTLNAICSLISLVEDFMLKNRTYYNAFTIKWRRWLTAEKEYTRRFVENEGKSLKTFFFTSIKEINGDFI